MNIDDEQFKEVYARISKKYRAMTLKTSIPYSVTTLLMLMASMVEENCRDKLIKMFDNQFDELKKFKDEYDDFIKDYE